MRLATYPRLHLLSNNRVSMSGFYGYSTTSDPDPALPSGSGLGTTSTSTWSGPVASGHFRDYGASVLVPNVGNVPSLRDEVMILGGGDYGANAVRSDSKRLLAATLGATWAPAQSMGGPRMVANVVLAPNGDIVLIGGSSDYYFLATPPTPAYRTLVWNRSADGSNCLRDLGVSVAATPAKVFQRARIVGVTI